MMAWISQGLEKVVPQPDLKSKESSAGGQQAQAQQAAATAELQSTGKDLDPADQTAPPSMMEWIKYGIVKVVPQPEILPKTEGSNKSETQAPPKAPPAAPPPATRPAAETEPPKEAEQQPNMMGWIVSGIGRMLPQPVPKLDAGSEGQSISNTQKKTDLVLEDLEELKEEPQVQSNQQASTKETDDAETQVDQLTPLMDSIKKGAEEAVLAHMEERLQQERLEVARVAEEMARKAAEEAVRQLEVEHSAKIVIETLPESNEQCLVDVCPAEPEAAAEENKVESLAPPTIDESTEQVTPSSTDVEPASETRDLESPVTQQTERNPGKATPPTTEQSDAVASAEEAPGGSGAPSLCAPIKSFLLQFPLAAECLERCRKLIHEHDLTPPTLSMPTPPRELAELTRQLSQLPEHARQHCSNIASHIALPSFLSSLKRSILQQSSSDT